MSEEKISDGKFEYISVNKSITHFVSGHGEMADPYLLAPFTSLKDGLSEAFQASLDPSNFALRKAIYFVHNVSRIGLNSQWELACSYTDDSPLPQEKVEEIETLVKQLRKEIENPNNVSEAEDAENQEEIRLYAEAVRRREKSVISKLLYKLLDLLTVF